MALCYQGKKILAPMVRVGTLPMRLLALKYGADIVYAEEIIDFKILKTTRFENKILGTVDFLLADGTVVFRTCDEEKQKVVFQMGTADPDRAVRAAKMLENDVAGIDVNMGCPKDYSVKGGMGAALLTQPENVKRILTALVKEVSKPVTCKIRILPTIEETVAFAKLVERTGIVALGVHGREKHERPRDPVHIDVIREVAQAVSIPVIANGVSTLVKGYADIEKYRVETGCSSVMLARAAQWNPSIFREEGRVPSFQVIQEYIKLAIKFDNTVGNTKYCIQGLLHEDTTSAEAKLVQATGNMREICGLICVNCRRDFSQSITPKVLLLEWTRKKSMNPPTYEIIEREVDRWYKSIVVVGDKKYSSTEWVCSKKFAHQSAALVCLQALGIHDTQGNPTIT
ncbi:PREDICTED: tRNA-dihydrouridine(20) synthase [NAD(P)+]-like [Acropora digitifera]|uniref:tRNA-dihydrouridine(20) synthase [NAD(P)+]-like n=1 Tax=Acropora digitifera TaxID=70779 RepID=UPI00077AEBAD|nr:PREDICTED: tRNA-dihydrouridine(20) synthase [NAD(P)+]-like [Acropora digitifera]